MIENVFKDHDDEFLEFLKEIDNDIKQLEDNKNNILVVLDVDLTLVCANLIETKFIEIDNIIESKNKEIEEFVKNLREKEMESADYNIIYSETKFFKGNKRPHLNKFLDFLFENFDVAVWSAGNKEYINPSIDQIFGERKNDLKFVYTADQCDEVKLKDQMVKIKPLSKIRGYHPDKIIHIDDNRDTFIKNPYNALKISGWTDNKDDNKLLKCIEILKILKGCNNIPRTITDFKFHEGF